MGQLEDIQVFLRVVESGGISRAAEQLNIAKSAVSRRLTELESRLQTKLIHRTTRRFNLTEAGKLYYERALGVVDSVKELDNVVVKSSEHFEGQLNLALPLSFGLLHMTPVIDAFMKKHPKLKIKVDLSDKEINLVEEGVDIAFRIGVLHDSSIQARKILPIELVICASPEYLEIQGEPNSVKELSQRTFLRYSAESAETFTLIDKQGAEETLAIKGRLQSNNGDFLKMLAMGGHGLVVIPTFVCWRELQSGELIRVMPDYKLPTLNGYAIYPQNRFLSQSARGFIDFLVEYFSGKPYWDAI
ncbi:LysR family transcriptional regulator [Thiomicrorhabdus immobilis]|uniref:LysR family transcriptional regulator n=1 Tax=Thiomicrorhabdus immobilis TaxID=2791037 RepID=A0ABN6D048_9GAMM|nr:LysR family transcriptional regulator [Thiomicrorhabdus immobilis]BCN93492.1 LysR family transcriptional regulator [Thiomicrorhabdus immobilis]